MKERVGSVVSQNHMQAEVTGSKIVNDQRKQISRKTRMR